MLWAGAGNPSYRDTIAPGVSRPAIGHLRARLRRGRLPVEVDVAVLTESLRSAAESVGVDVSLLPLDSDDL